MRIYNDFANKNKELKARLAETEKLLAAAKFGAAGACEQKLAQQALVTERKRLYDVLEALPVYVILLDKDYHVPFANKFFRQRFGEAQGKCCYDFLFNRKQPCQNCDTYKVMKTKAPHHWEWIGPDKRNYDIYDFPFFNTDGSMMILEMGIDITDQINIELELKKHRQHLEMLVKEKTGELQESEERFRLAASATNAVVYEIDLIAGCVNIFPGIKGLLGFDLTEIGELTLEWWNRQVYPQDLNICLAAYKKIIDESSDISSEYRMLHKDGQLVFIENRATSVCDAAGKVVRIIGTLVDITKHKQAEHELFEYARAQEILSSAATELLKPMSYFELIQFSVRQIRQITGSNSIVILNEYDSKADQTIVRAVDGSDDKVAKVEAILGKPLAGLRFSVVKDIWQPMVKGSLTHVSGGIHDLSFRQMPKELCHHIEAELGINNFYVMPFSIDDDLIGTVIIGVDSPNGLWCMGLIESFINQISLALKNKRAEEILQENEKRLQMALQVSNSFAFEWDPVNDIVHRSDSCWPILGLTREEAIDDKGANYFKRVHPQDHDRFVNMLKALKPGLDSYRTEYRVVRGDGSIVALEETAQASFDTNGKFIRLVGTTTNITSRKEAEDILRRDKETLKKLVEEQADKIIVTQIELEQVKRLSDVGTLAATVAHELRNPLAAIALAANNLKRKIKNPEFDKHFMNINKKIFESDQIINNLLFYSRIKPPNYANVNITDIIEECIDSFKDQIKKNISIIKKIDLLQNKIVEVDSIQIKEVIFNILNNAYDAIASEGMIEIKGVFEHALTRLSITDNGCGINKEDQEKVFDPFFTTKAKGTGLGLSVCWHIVNLHDGFIGVQSEPGKGTEVAVYLPENKRRNRQIINMHKGEVKAISDLEEGHLL